MTRDAKSVLCLCVDKMGLVMSERNEPKNCKNRVWYTVFAKTKKAEN